MFAGLLAKIGLNVSAQAASMFAKLGMILAILSILAGIFYTYRADIKQGVYDKVYAEQVEAKYKEQQDQLEKLHEQLTASQQALQVSNEQKAEIAKTYTGILSQIVNSKAQDGELAPILLEAVNSLRALQAQKGVLPHGK